MYRNIPEQTQENFAEARRDKKIVCWGRSKRTPEEAFKNAAYIVDSCSELWGTRYLDLEVYSPMQLYSESPENTVILVTAGPRYATEITNAINAIDDFTIFYSHVLIKEFLNIFSVQLFEHMEKIKAIERLLYDNKSKQIFREVVWRRIIGSTWGYDDLKAESEPQYLFAPMYEHRCPQEIILDCGAYIGDSAKKFVNYFGDNAIKIYSFEALPENLEKLNQTKEELSNGGWKGQLCIMPFAVSDKTATVKFKETAKQVGGFLSDVKVVHGTNNAIVNEFEVETRAIDNVIPAEEKVTLIKMDIEGAEYSALIGARKTIMKYKPRCAISIYHNPSDYWTICELLHSYVPEYKFAIRHHHIKHCDTVLYAWTEE